MIQPRQRDCKLCNKPFVSNETTCTDCKRKKKQDKLPTKKQVDFEAMRGKNNSTGSSKRKKSQEELDIEKKKKEAEKAIKAKERAKKRKENKRAEKLISMTNLQVLHQKFIRLVTPNICASCNKVTTSEKGGNQASGGHMVEKGRCKSTALLVMNLYNQCWTCNSKNLGNGRPLDLYKYGCKFWSTSSMDEIIEMAKVSYSFDKGERMEIYDYVTEKIKLAETLNSLREKENLLREVNSWQQSQQWFINIKNQIK
jgi:hypothetical protein